MPPWNPILGHLYFCYKIASTIPGDAHPNYLPDIIRRELPDLGPIYYLDLWPVGPQMLVVASTGGLYQITQEHSLPKYHAMKYFLEPITGGMDIVTMEGDLWKTWRGIFNPGFSGSHLMTLTSSVVEETERFCDILQERVRDQKLFRMKDLTDNLTMDIIGRVVL
jgi:sterigmatocystin biosynthesis cytochrome P450 monooxygenase